VVRAYCAMFWRAVIPEDLEARGEHRDELSTLAERLAAAPVSA
jgi:hypothetical protein